MRLTPKKVFIIALVIFLLLMGFFLYKKEIRPTILPNTARLSSQEESGLQKELKELVLSESPKEAIEKLRQEGERDPRVLRICHDLAHFIGHESMKRYGSFKEAAMYQDSLCNSGYLHGVIEETLEREPTSSSAFLGLCGGATPGTFTEWECFHGLGHGLMFMKHHDLPQALSGCAAIVGTGRKEECVNGAYMEIFSIDGVQHRSAQLDSSDPMATCADAGEYSPICALYAPTQYLLRHSGDYVGAFDYCAGVATPFRAACVSGVGMQAMKEHLDDPEFVTRVCDAAPLLSRSSCKGGAASILIFHHGNLAAAKAVCQNTSWQKECEQMVAKSAAPFSDIAGKEKAL